MFRFSSIFFLFFYFFTPADSDLIETFQKGVLKGGSFLCVSQWRMKLNMHAVYLFIFRATSTTIGERKASRWLMIVQSRNWGVYVLPVTLLSERLFYDDDDDDDDNIMKVVETHGFTEAVQTLCYM